MLALANASNPATSQPMRKWQIRVLPILPMQLLLILGLSVQIRLLNLQARGRRFELGHGQATLLGLIWDY
jgi:hypothetical protein